MYWFNILITFKAVFMLWLGLFLLNCQLFLCTMLLTFILITSLISISIQQLNKSIEFTNLHNSAPAYKQDALIRALQEGSTEFPSFDSYSVAAELGPDASVRTTGNYCCIVWGLQQREKRKDGQSKGI